MKLFLSLLVIVLAGGFMFTSCSSFGSSPNKNELLSYNKSENFDQETKLFKNKNQKEIDSLWKNMNMWESGKEFLFGGEDHKSPDKDLPSVKFNKEEFLNSSENIKAVWFGHSTVLLRIDGKNILLDPVFSNYASPVSFMVRRFQSPAAEMEDLPEIDYVLISHDHYDHLDMPSIKFFKNKKAKFVTPLAVGAHLRGWGIDADRITELDWWEDVDLDGIKVVATPSQHFSGRGISDRNETLWASYVIIGEKEKVYFSGDSGYGDHFKEIGNIYGPIDLAFMENGQYNEKWRLIHMFPEETAQASLDLQAQNVVSIHWGMFNLALHSWYTPIKDLKKESDMIGVNLLTPKLGELINIESAQYTDKWWEDFMPESEKELPQIETTKK